MHEEKVEKEGEKKTKKRGRQGDKPQQEAKRHTIHTHTRTSVTHTRRVFVCVCARLRGSLHEREGERQRKGGRVTRRLGEPPPLLSSSPSLSLLSYLPSPLPSSLSLCGAGV